MKKDRAPQLPFSHRRHFDNSRSAQWSGHPRTVAFLAGLLVLLVAQAGGRANVGAVEPLPFSKGFLVTGNYVVGGVDLTPQANPADMNGYATGTIQISGAPAGGANLVAAYLYFEGPSEPCPGRRKSNARHQVPRSGDQSGAIRAVSKLFSSGAHLGISGSGLLRSVDVRANVLRSAQTVRPQGKWTESIVNSAELPERPAHGDVARKTGNSAIQSAGATLLSCIASLIQGTAEEIVA
jgi:hypothetical protein